MLLLLACLNGDADGDGFARSEDCDDNNASRYPDADEVCDGVDNNCNGLIDEGGGTELLDLDGDGYGGLVSVGACTTGGTATQDGDCNDGNPAAFPGAPEICNGQDDDCDGAVDEEPTDAATWYLDGDGDGWGHPDEQRYGCLGASGLVAVAGDCDDEDPGVFPGATETCDGVDEDCDGTVDDDTEDGTIWYADLDGDGYGGLIQQVACDAPGEGWLDDGGTDCNDGDPTTFPGADEYCDRRDNDCNGVVDDDTALDTQTWYADDDDDGFGDLEDTTEACDAPEGFVNDASDCDDDDEDVHPDAEEVCRDGVDNDCDDTANDCVLSGDLDPNDAEATFSSTSSYQYFGMDVAVLDHDGDGVDDIAIGAYGYNDYRGGVFVTYGSTTVGDASLSSMGGVDTTTFNTYLGMAMDSGDFNGDGVEDIIAGGYYANSGYGVAVIIEGGSTLTSMEDRSNHINYTGSSSYSRAGHSVAGVGDLDGDGYDELAVGGYYHDYGYGRTWLVYGDASLSGGNLGSAYDAYFYGNSSGVYVGYRDGVDGVGDLDGDGYDDLAVGSWGYDNPNDEGCMGLMYGGSSALSGTYSVPNGLDAYIEGEDHNDRLAIVSHVGDVDGDGYDDLAVGSTHNDSQRGKVYLFYGGVTALSGSVDATSADGTIRGDDTNQYFGSDFHGADLDDDGANELLIGAHYSDGGTSDGGAVFIIPGDSYTTNNNVSDVATAMLAGDENESYAGWALGVGDVNDDDYIDPVVAAYCDASSYTCGGEVWLFLGTGM